MRSQEQTPQDVASSSPDRLSSLAAVGATREVLQRHGLATKHALGQNFLVNDDIVKKIVQLAEVREGDYVLEVGPGIGTLTQALLKCADKVVAVEQDRDLPAVLRETLDPWWQSFRLVEKDALTLSVDDIACDGAFPSKFVSNLPYAVAATLVLDFFQRFAFLESATVMVQKEVADRMMAAPGSKTYGAYTVKLGLYAQPAGRFPVSPGNFFPPPHVDSAVLRLNRSVALDKDGSPIDDDLRRATCTMADAAFSTRRKTLANSCKTYFSGKGPQGKHVAASLGDVFEGAGIDARRRGETLTQQEFIELGKQLLQLQ